VASVDQDTAGHPKQTTPSVWRVRKMLDARAALILQTARRAIRPVWVLRRTGQENVAHAHQIVERVQLAVLACATRVTLTIL